MGLEFDEAKATETLKQKKVKILVKFNMGEAEATAWGCDLTYDYVKINADQNHLRNFHGILVCHTQTVDKLRLTTIFFNPIIDCRTTTMHNHWVDSYKAAVRIL